MTLEAYFNSKNAKKLLHNKFVVFLGDSVQRSCYKDLVLLLQENRVLSRNELRTKGEDSFLNDKIIERSEKLSNNSSYKEVREYKTDHHLVRFYFITRIYNNYVESVLEDFEDPYQPTPDVVILNSCVWDISRYCLSWQQGYQQKLEKLCSRLDEILPVQTCIIWRNALPLGGHIKAGLLTESKYSLRNRTLPADIVLANVLAHAVATKHKYDVVDMFFHFILNQDSLAEDGLHWNAQAHRKMTNILLIHISKAWLLGLPEYVDIQYYTDDSDTAMQNNFDYQQPLPKFNLLDQQFEERYGGPIRSAITMFKQQNPIFNQINPRQNEISQNYNHRPFEISNPLCLLPNPIQSTSQNFIVDPIPQLSEFSQLTPLLNLQFHNYDSYPLREGYYESSDQFVARLPRHQRNQYNPYPNTNPYRNQNKFN